MHIHIEQHMRCVDWCREDNSEAEIPFEWYLLTRMQGRG
jgi:hypothetical protein